MHANAYGAAEGTAAAKENLAVLSTSSELLSEEIYDLVANLFKVKLDEAHRVVDSAKTVLMSRMQEAKLARRAREGPLGEARGKKHFSVCKRASEASALQQTANSTQTSDFVTCLIKDRTGAPDRARPARRR